jgi:hypothetical protein
MARQVDRPKWTSPSTGKSRSDLLHLIPASSHHDYDAPCCWVPPLGVRTLVFSKRSCTAVEKQREGSAPGSHSGSAEGHSSSGERVGSVLLRRYVQQFRGGLVFKAHRLVYHTPLGWRVIKKNKLGAHPGRTEGRQRGTRRSGSSTGTWFRV